MVFGRNIWLYLALGLMLSLGVDWQKCFLQRAKYLLGIYHNGHYQNELDGTVYKDFLKRHHATHESIVRSIQ